MMTEEKLKEIEGKIKSLTAAEVQDIQKRIRTELYNYGIKKMATLSRSLYCESGEYTN